MRIAICEDNGDELLVLSDAITTTFSRMGCGGEITAFESGELLLEAFHPGAFDILFLDVYLPGISGLDTARKIRETDRNCLLVFITVSPDFALEGFGVQASGYVVKPLSQSKLEGALHMCRETILRAGRVIEVPSGREGSVAIPAMNIRYVEVEKNRTCFHTMGGAITAYLTLDEVEAMLGGEPFLRCHRSYLVNMNHVEEMGVQDFLMAGGGLAPIRKNGRKEIRLAMTRFLATNSSMDAVPV